MNILHIAAYYPSLRTNHAGGVLMGHEIEYLKKNNNVYSLSFVQKKYDHDLALRENKEGYVTELLSFSTKLLNVLCHPNLPVFFATRASNKTYNKICNIIEEKEIDAVHAEFSAMGFYSKLKKKYPNVIFTYVMHDIAYQGYERKLLQEKNFFKRFLLKNELRKIKKCERKWICYSDHVLTFSSKDVKLANSLYKTEKVRRINIFIPGLDESIPKYRRDNDGFKTIMFFGQMGRFENEDAALSLLEVFRKVAKPDTNYKLMIIGNAPTRKVISQAKLVEIETERPIEVTGFVDDPDRLIVTKCDLGVFPLHQGAGIKIKVITTMALGIPVITTEVGAEGIDENGKYLKLVNNEDEIVDCISGVLDNTILGEKGREYVLSEFAWKVTEEVFDNIYKK